jgi:hypothetical protein
VSETWFSRVVGKAATEPLLPDDPKNARNRRLSIILLRGTAEGNPAAPGAQGAKGGRAKQDEALPGLNDIKRQQLDEQLKSGGGPPAWTVEIANDLPYRIWVRIEAHREVSRTPIPHEASAAFRYPVLLFHGATPLSLSDWANGTPCRY